jgi:hypothetical protein
MTNWNNYVKFPLNFQKGLGYSPAAAGPVGGYSYTPGPGFFGKQPMESLLPRLTGPGSTPANGHFFGRKRSFFGRKRSFGYPLMNRPSESLNEVMFPRYPVGDGSTPGGDGGVQLQGMPSFQAYWGFGKHRRSRRSRRRSHRSNRRSRRRSRRSNRRSRRSNRRSNRKQ